MIEIEQLKKYYGSNKAIDIEHYSIGTGDMLGLVGNNGAGKTTLFRLILDLVKADAGRVTIGGIDVSYRAKKERNRLTPREVVRLRYMDTGALSPSALFARDVFLFSVVTRGMTGGDIFRLTADSIKGGTLSYTSSLTGRRETVGWTPLMQEIVDRHARPGTPYLFPVITAADPQEQWRQHSVALHNINRNLKRVGQMLGLSFPLNMTVAHHSWDAMERVTNASELM